MSTSWYEEQIARDRKQLEEEAARLNSFTALESGAPMGDVMRHTLTIAPGVPLTAVGFMNGQEYTLDGNHNLMVDGAPTC